MGSKNQIKKNGTEESTFLQNRSCRFPQANVTEKCIAEIGTYDPNIEPSAYKVNEEEAKKWLAAGAQPTDVVAKIFKEAGIEK